MEPSGCNRWQRVANAATSKTAQIAENRCRGLVGMTHRRKVGWRRADMNRTGSIRPSSLAAPLGEVRSWLSALIRQRRRDSRRVVLARSASGGGSRVGMAAGTGSLFAVRRSARSSSRRRTSKSRSLCRPSQRRASASSSWTRTRPKASVLRLSARARTPTTRPAPSSPTATETRLPQHPGLRNGWIASRLARGDEALDERPRTRL
jgi:hypothetical protein